MYGYILPSERPPKRATRRIAESGTGRPLTFRPSATNGAAMTYKGSCVTASKGAIMRPSGVQIQSGNYLGKAVSTRARWRGT